MRLRHLLYPLSLPYHLITAVRNQAFDMGILKSKSFDVPVLAIGNLSTGGTGKTPMTEFLIKHLKEKKIGLVSRGYGRKTKGLILATPQHRFDEIGDEPHQIFHKFPQIKMALAEKRVEGIQVLLETEKPDLILLDDAYQHRYVKAGFNILLTTYANPFYSDFILPAGNLRESRNGKKRANMMVVTKCPDNLSKDEAIKIQRKLRPEKGQSVYFAGLEYGEPVNYLGKGLVPKSPASSGSVQALEGGQGDDSIILLTGIANPTPMREFLDKSYKIIRHLKYPDHHNFNTGDLEEIRKANSVYSILTTEKDWVRLNGLLEEDVLKNIYYLPMQMKILFGEEEKLLSEVYSYISKKQN